MCKRSTASSGKIKSVTLSDEKIQLKANTRSIISCYFTPRSSIRNDKVSLEWEKEKGGEYIPLIQFVDNKVKKVSLQDNRFQVFKNLVHRGNCSLIISSTKLIDSGNYQLRLTVGGKLFKPLPRIKVQVEKTKELKQGRLHAPHSGNKNWKKPISDNRKLSTALNHVTSDEKDGEKQPSSNHAKLTPELIAGVTSICSVAVLTFVIACVVYCYRTRSKQKAPAQDEERLTSPEKEMDPKDPKPQCRSKKARKKDKADQENPKPQGLTSPEKEMDPKDLKPQCRSKKARKKDKADQENTKPQGFPNLGNTCYMNATLQSLLSVQPFVSDLLQQKIPYKTFQEFVFIRNLYNLIRRKDRYSLKKRRKLLLKLKDSVSISAERFADNEQHDAHDFLTECFSLMKEDIAQLSNEMKNPISCPVKSNFEFDLEYIYICNKCGETRISVNQNNCLFVDILQEDSNSDSASETLQDAVDYYFLDETVEFSCEKCGGNESTLKQKFRSLPRQVFYLSTPNNK
ncbi:uncharacterized protein LOC108701848 [Xenopus laevis]|uniref:Uncharacterized protein LOC108701848 n=1 Tax=Xenopus laevis TaxID=8355 RepID=A0A8J1LWK5_XENLA|nr:uncharacterized protein LOC108701848 [Xenopus laevis]